MEIEIDGIKINYEQHGAGENVLVLHGWGASIQTMRPIVDALKDRYRVTALDFPGFGLSDAPPDSFGVPDVPPTLDEARRIWKTEAPEWVATADRLGVKLD